MNTRAATVLWVEDQFDTIKGTVRRLRRLGHTVDVCISSEEAKQLLLKRKYSHVIVDFQIPQSDGSDPIKGEGLNFIDYITPPTGEFDYRPERVLLLTAQSANLKRDFEFQQPIKCEVVAKPGSLHRIQKWIEAGTT